MLKSEPDPFRAVFDQSPLPMMLCDVGTLDVLCANRLAAELHGVSPEQLVGTSLFELRRVSDLTSVMLKRAVGREIALGFGYHTRKNGSIFPVQLSVYPSDLGGRPAWLCVMKSLEDALARASDDQQRRLDEALGRLSAGMAHDLNNLLSVILSFASLASSQREAAAETLDLSEIRSAAERAAAITKQLLNLSRKTPSAPKPLVLNDVVTRLEKTLRRLLDEQLTLELSLEPALDAVLADSNMLERLLVQLATEARQSSTRGSSLLIETRQVTLDAAGGEDGRHVMLRVSDSGSGLSPEVALRLFEPVPGNAWLETEPGAGTRFVACFPALAPRAHVVESRRQRGRPETVLVVQDNPHLRKTLKTYFAREGYRVLDADCSIAAVRLAEQEPRVDLVLSDFMLTDGSGVELGAALRQRSPSLKLLITIGHPEQRAAIPEDSRIATIDKPFDLQRFGELVARLLETQPRR